MELCGQPRGETFQNALTRSWGGGVVATTTNMKNFLLMALGVITLCFAGEAGQVTLTVNTQPNLGVVILSDQVTIATNEVATVQSVYGYNSGFNLKVIKNGITNLIGVSNLGSQPGTKVAGPAQIVLAAEGGQLGNWFCTIKTEPESFPPDKTIIIPQGTPGANIIMEQSTDLVNWTNSAPGLYTNTAINHLFFRLRAERL